MELGRHECGELIVRDAACGEWFHPVFVAHGGREVCLVHTEIVARERRPRLFG